MSAQREEISLEKIYEEFGVEPYLSETDILVDSVDIDDILFEEMFKTSKQQVDATEEELEDIIKEYTQEIHVAQAPVREEPVIKEEPKKEPAQKATKHIKEQKAVKKTHPEKKQRRFPYVIIAAFADAAILVFAIVMLLQLRPTYTVKYENETITLRTFERNTEAVLELTALEYDTEAKIETETTNDNVIITVTDPFEVNFICDGKTKSVTTTGATLKELLKNANITLGENDEISRPLEDTITNAQTVTVNRVTYKERFEEEIIPAPVDDQSDGAEHTYTVEGQSGAAIVTYRDKYVNGKLEDSKEINRKITTEAVATLILSLEHDGAIPENDEIPEDYIRVIDIECTAYHLPGNRTATGKWAQRGYVAVDPSVIPLGTKMYICSEDGKFVYGYCQAEDTGSAVKGNIVDLHMDSVEECMQFGRRKMIAYIIEEG